MAIDIVMLVQNSIEHMWMIIVLGTCGHLVSCRPNSPVLTLNSTSQIFVSHYLFYHVLKVTAGAGFPPPVPASRLGFFRYADLRSFHLFLQDMASLLLPPTALTHSDILFQISRFFLTVTAFWSW